MSRSRTTRRALLAGAATPLVACGLSDLGGAPAVKFGDPISVSFWHTQNGTNQRVLEDLAAKFNQANGKNITLKPEYQGTYPQAHQKVLAAIQSGLKPDAAGGLDHSIAEWARLGALVDLADYVDRGPSPLPRGSTDDLFPIFLSPGRYETATRGLYALPFAKSVTTLFMNEELMSRALGPSAKLSG